QVEIMVNLIFCRCHYSSRSLASHMPAALATPVREGERSVGASHVRSQTSAAVVATAEDQIDHDLDLGRRAFDALLNNDDEIVMQRWIESGSDEFSQRTAPVPQALPELLRVALSETSDRYDRLLPPVRIGTIEFELQARCTEEKVCLYSVSAVHRTEDEAIIVDWNYSTNLNYVLQFYPL
ncbi:MAG: hypothetical protein AAGJ96_05480, partial [Pseudomonadota bacterium]